MTDNAQQVDYWNGEAGRRWVDHDAQLEGMLQPVTAALLGHVKARSSRALDIGCGCGNQTLALARHLGAVGTVTGIDISEPMLAVARARLHTDPAAMAAVEFLRTDAAAHPFVPAGFDLLFSRFGVMFFADPGAAFHNLRRALTDHGDLVFCCWQAPGRNTWFRVPMQAALRHIPAPAPADPHAPGPFAFADIDRVCSILEQAGFASVSSSSLETELCLAQAPSLDQAVQMLVQVGPINSLLAAQDEPVRAAALAEIGAAVKSFYSAGRLLMPAAIWVVTAKAGCRTFHRGGPAENPRID